MFFWHLSGLNMTSERTIQAVKQAERQTKKVVDKKSAWGGTK